jgi:flagellar hook assembly protein FlgD
LGQNYPNPFNPATNIEFELAVDGWATLKVYDLLGREVANLIEGWKKAGTHRVTFDSRNSNFSGLPSGIYMYRLSTNGFSDVKRMVVLK